MKRVKDIMEGKKEYEISINGLRCNEYIRGAIYGMIVILTGGNNRGKNRWSANGLYTDLTYRYVASEEEQRVIHETLNENFPQAYVGVKEIE